MNSLKDLSEQIVEVDSFYTCKELKTNAKLAFKEIVSQGQGVSIENFYCYIFYILGVTLTSK